MCSSRRGIACVVLLGSLAGACSKSAAPGSDAAVVTSGASESTAIAGWDEAKSLDEAELARLAAREGATGLADVGREREDYRMVALSAMAYVDTFSELPWLVDMAERGSDAEGAAALESVIDLAARRRMSTEPADADELSIGCKKLKEFVFNTKRPVARRVLAARAAMMLRDRECARELGAFVVPPELFTLKK